MYQGEIVGTRIKPTENTTLAKLSVLDQLKLLIGKFTNEDVAELDAAEKLSANSLKVRASLIKLFETACTNMTENGKSKVTLSVSSKFLTYIDDITNSVDGMGRYYSFEIIKRDLPITVDYKVIVIIRKKVS